MTQRDRRMLYWIAADLAEKLAVAVEQLAEGPGGPRVLDAEQTAELMRELRDKFNTGADRAARSLPN